MKVLFVTQSLGKGGAERLVLDIANTFMNFHHNVEVKIVSLGTVNDFSEISEGLDIEICNSMVQLSLTGKSNIQINDFELIVDDFQPDVIHSHTYTAELVSREKPRKGIVYVSHVHATFPEFEPFHIKTLFSKKRIANYFERRRIMKKYRQVNNYFISISGSIDNDLRKQISPNLHKNILYLPNAIDYAKFEVIPKDLVGNTVQLINIGRFYHVKNHLYQIEVLKVLVNDYPEFNWQLLMLGEGPLRNAIEEKVNEYQLQGNIALPGLVSEVEHQLKHSHIYLHSAISEPFGLVIVEAMAASLPVVTLDGKGNKDFILHGVNGYLFPQETQVKDFAKKIFELVTDKKLYHSIAFEANKTAKEYDIYPYVTNLKEFYNVKIVSIKTL